MLYSLKEIIEIQWYETCTIDACITLKKKNNKKWKPNKQKNKEFQFQRILDTPKKNTYIASSMKEISVSTSGC